MYDLPPNTVASFLVNPAQQTLDLRDVPLSSIVEPLRVCKTSTMNTEQAVLKFYFYNHAFHLITNSYNKYDRLPPQLAGVCQRNQILSNSIGKRMFFQVLMATHGHLFGLENHKPNFKDFFAQQYGKPMLGFFEKHPNSYHFSEWLHKFPQVSCGEFFLGTLATFSFCGAGAAKAWTNIARLSADYISGMLSLESMTDQAFSVCHNGGSILNKGHMFTICTQTMYHLLDVQDSGQIPQWILNNLFYTCVDEQLKKDAQLMGKLYPELTEQVDAKKVASSTEKRAAYTNNIAKNWQANNWKAPLPAAKPHPHEKLHQVLLGNTIKI